MQTPETGDDAGRSLATHSSQMWPRKPAMVRDRSCPQNTHSASSVGRLTEGYRRESRPAFALRVTHLLDGSDPVQTGVEALEIPLPHVPRLLRCEKARGHTRWPRLQELLPIEKEILVAPRKAIGLGWREFTAAASAAGSTSASRERDDWAPSAWRKTRWHGARRPLDVWQYVRKWNEPVRVEVMRRVVQRVGIRRSAQPAPRHRSREQRVLQHGLRLEVAPKFHRAPSYFAPIVPVSSSACGCSGPDASCAARCETPDASFRPRERRRRRELERERGHATRVPLRVGRASGD